MGTVIEQYIDNERSISFFMPMIYFSKPNIPGIGRIYIAANKRGIVRVSIGGSRKEFLKELPENNGCKEDEARFSKIIKKISDLTKGKRVRFDARLDLHGTPFQKRVWMAIAKIPWGETRSYAWLAKQAGNSRAIRAAANACGANAIPLIIPCHRVIASDGSIGGFSGGIDLKKKLLELEGIEFN